MRRFVAYCLSSLTILLGIGVAFKPVATSINADLSYRNGKTITFKLFDRENKKEEIKDEEAAKNYASVIDARLKTYGAVDYVVNTIGYDTIKVTLAANNSTEYSNISTYLCVNPKIEFATTIINDKHPEQIVNDNDGSFSWNSSNAYIAFDGSTSICVMPIPEGAKTKVEELVKKAKEAEDEKTSNDDQPKKSIALWMNRIEGEAYSDKDTNENIKSKIIYDSFNSTNFYYGTNKDAIQIRFAPSSNTTVAISEAYQKAQLHMNMWNASQTDYDCKQINIEEAPARVENLLIYGSEHVHIAMSATFISFLIATIIICLLLALFYRITSVAIITSAGLTTFLTFLGFTLFKPAFGIAALVGLTVVALSSIFVGISHNNHFHEEVYKGRSLKKANYEASKKTTLLTVDISVISILLGILVYFVGGKQVAGFGIVLIIASVVNLLINTFILKALMWLITNNTSTQTQYKLFGIDPSKIPDLTKEQKPFYDGTFEKKNLSKHKNIAAIAFGVVTLASSIVLGVMAGQGKIFNSGSYYATTNQIRFTIKDDVKDPIPSMSEFKTNVINNIKFKGETVKYNTDIESFKYTLYDSSASTKGTHTYYAYAITINETDINSTEYSYKEKDGLILSEAFEAALDEQFGSSIVEDNILKESINYTDPTNVGMIFAATIIASIISCLYLWIRRYRLSRVLTTFAFSLISSVITLGIISMTRIVTLPIASIAVAITVAYTIMMSLFIMHKDKDLIKDERVRDADTRKKVLNRSLLMGMVPANIFALIALFTAANMFGFGARAFAAIFIAGFVGMLSSTIMVVTLFTTCANFLDEKFMRVKIPEIHIKKKKTVTKKSNEPQEAIFIGIND